MSGIEVSSQKLYPKPLRDKDERQPYRGHNSQIQSAQDQEKNKGIVIHFTGRVLVIFIHGVCDFFEKPGMLPLFELELGCSHPGQ